jgi:phosphate uptake regulator
MIMTVVKTITDLERIGDEAAKIARVARVIGASDRLMQPRFTEIKRMAILATAMLRKALDAFARLDVAASAEVVRQDQHVDEEFRGVIRQLITFMMEDPRTISASIEILFIAKAIERIGDHAKNISEYVIYMVKGKDVRHVETLGFTPQLDAIDHACHGVSFRDVIWDGRSLHGLAPSTGRPQSAVSPVVAMGLPPPPAFVLRSRAKRLQR